jgi:hypothetical protein
VSGRARGIARGLALVVASLLWLGCRSDPPSVPADGGRADGGVADAPGPDGPPAPPGCNGPVAGAPQCSNCIDDDGDGFIDSFDLECTGPLDNDESSFATGIPGDNIDPVKQDCFFDGNSGGGDDGCDIHVCCLLGATTVAECPIGANQYNPMSCPPPIGTTPLSQKCIDTCGALTPPGCDCFGCCTLCDPNDPSQCYDIATNPATSPGCNSSNLADPTICKRCTKVTSCGNSDCGGDTCILCPGQTEDDLPPGCNGDTSCPSGTQSCANGETCPSQTYCHEASMCCVGIIGLQ